MRLRNVRGAKDIIASSNYVLNKPSDYKGKYKIVFDNNNPIHVEIGCGKGRFIIENAKKYPDINFIGIEKFDSVLIKAIKSLNEDLPNLKFIRMDASSIEEVFDYEVDVLYLNFSDPWPKDRHQKRRLTSPEFLKRYDNIFKSDKIIKMKTDNRKLFEYSIMSFNNSEYKIEDLSLNLYDDDIKDNIPTEYEIKFSTKGERIYYIKVIK